MAQPEVAAITALPHVLSFEDPLPAGADARDLLGGKAAGLVEMRQVLELPVPPGFVITTAACREYLQSGWPSGLDEAVAAAMDRLGQQLGARFGDERSPLLVSVRSGAPVSMPGMMDTLLNVGMNEAAYESLAASTGDEAFAADCWLRFRRMYAEIVLGIAGGVVGGAALHDGTTASMLGAVERVRAVAHGAGRDIPDDPWLQLRSAIEAVFRSCNSERARVFREREGIPDGLGTAVTVQAMVFGNRDATSGTGVVFTRNPSTGEAVPFGDYLPLAQGEDVVAGTHAVGGLDALKAQSPAVYAELLETLARLETHTRDMCDVEFTVSSGRLYILQTRVGRRTPFAAARIAVEMADDPAFPLTRAEAVSRVDAAALSRLAEEVRVEAGAEPIGSGLAASPGVGAGGLCFDANRAAELAAAGQPVVLTRESTSPEDVHGMVGAAAIVTTRGGVVSHAAVVARSWSIPALTSLEGARIEGASLIVGSLVLHEGEVVTVDGGRGLLFRGDRREHGAAEAPWVRTIRDWATDLGLEPGDQAAESVDERGGTFTLFDLLRTVELKGLCNAARAAAYLGCAEEAVADTIPGAPELFKETPRGYMLTPDARARIAEELAVQRAAVGEGLEECYAAFVPLNLGFKQLVTGWQMGGKDGGEPALRKLAQDLRALHGEVLPILERAAATAPRLTVFRGRFELAVAAVEHGDASMLASPMKESYHTLWFDFHEELIALSGRNRADEET